MQFRLSRFAFARRHAIALAIISLANLASVSAWTTDAVPITRVEEDWVV
jgi:hypothetical protein